MSDDAELLRRYAASHRESDFAALVQRHLGLVYHTALRRVNGDTHLAEDIAQDVFAHLASRASALGRHPRLTGWLYTAARNAAANAMRAQQRRAAREQEASAMNQPAAHTPSAESWAQLQPELDRVMDQLSVKDRDALLLRFFDHRPFEDVGAALDLSENAARMRVQRALERLRSLLGRRGIHSTSAALSLLLSQNAIGATPAALAASVSTAALASATAAPTVIFSGLNLLHLMTSTKLVVSCAALAVCGSMGVALHQFTAARHAHGEVLTMRTDAERTRRETTAAVAAHEAALIRDRELADQLAAAETKLRAITAAEKKSSPPAKAATPNPTRFTANELGTLMKNPEYKRAWISSQRAGYKSRYGRLYRKLQLTPQQIAAFEIALLEMALSAADTMAAAQDQGLALDHPLMRKINDPAGTDAQSTIRTLLGESGYNDYKAFNMAANSNAIIDSVAGTLSYSETPLTADQGERLAQLIRVRTTPGSVSGMMSTGAQTDWNSVLKQAPGILAAPQIDTLRQAVERMESGVRLMDLRSKILAAAQE